MKWNYVQMDLFDQNTWKDAPAPDMTHRTPPTLIKRETNPKDSPNQPHAPARSARNEVL